MCWFSKHRAPAEPPSTGRLAILATRPPPMFDNLTSTEESGDDGLQYLCGPSAEPCANTSQYYRDYCEHGICCHNKELEEDEYCACYSSTYTGRRCDTLHLPELQGASDPWILVPVVLGVALVVLVIVLGVIRWRRNRSRCRNLTSSLEVITR